MNAFLMSAIHVKSSVPGNRTFVLGWIRSRLDRPQRRFRDEKAMSHLRQLPSYLLNDAGVDAIQLYGKPARIAEARAPLA